MTKINNQSGVALVTALLIVALTTIMAISLASRQYMDVRRTSNIMLADQAYLYDLALESFASQLLKTYRGNQQQKYDDMEQFQQAMMLFQAIPVEGGSVSATVEFPEGKFNVNTLVGSDGKFNPWARTYYIRLLGLVLRDLGMDSSLNDDLADTLIDWIDPDEEEGSVAGAEDGVYESKPLPYKAANRMMGSISELRMVEGYTKELLDGLPGDKDNPPKPGLLYYLSALPDRDTTININMIAKEDTKLMLAMASHMDDQIVQDLMEARPFENINNFTTHETFNSIKEGQPGNWTGEGGMENQLKDLGTHIDVQSSYFLLRGSATVGDSKITLNSLIYANTSGDKVEIVARAIGTPGI